MSPGPDQRLLKTCCSEGSEVRQAARGGPCSSTLLSTLSWQWVTVFQWPGLHVYLSQDVQGKAVVAALAVCSSCPPQLTTEGNRPHASERLQVDHGKCTQHGWLKKKESSTLK